MEQHFQLWHLPCQLSDAGSHSQTLFDSQSMWQIISQSSLSASLIFFFFLLISLGFGFLWLQPPLPIQSWTVEHGWAWQRVLAMLLDFCSLKAKQADFFFLIERKKLLQKWNKKIMYCYFLLLWAGIWWPSEGLSSMNYSTKMCVFVEKQYKQNQQWQSFFTALRHHVFLSDFRS